MKSILVIDDNRDIRENTAEILDLAGYKTFTAENGKKGVDLAIKERPDVIICDIMMPELDGYGVLHLLKKNTETQEIPFIFLTAFTDTDTITKAATYNPSCYLTKPVNATNLFSALQVAFFKQEKMEGTLSDYFFIKQGKHIKRIAWKTIAVIESERNYVAFKSAEILSFAPSGYLVRSTLQQAINQLIPQAYRHHFIQINRSTFINKYAILQITGTVVNTTVGSFMLQDVFRKFLNKELNIL